MFTDASALTALMTNEDDARTPGRDPARLNGVEPDFSWLATVQIGSRSRT